MSTTDYSELQQLIKVREQELQKKKEILEALVKSESIVEEHTEVLEPDGSLILDKLLAELEEAKKIARGQPPLIDNEKESELISPRPYVFQKKSLVQAVDLAITPAALKTLDKCLQCDTLTASTTADDQLDLQGSVNVTTHKTSSEKITRDSSFKDIKKKLSAQEESKKEFTEEEKNVIFQNPNFKSFFQKASKVIERALHESDVVDILADYNDVCVERDALNRAEQLSELATFQSSQCTVQRPVLGIQANLHYPETFLTCYGLKRNSTVADPDGCTLIWNLTLSSRPEYIFHCQSAIRCAIFDNYHPHCIIGGTFTGYIVIWDTRAKSYPVQQTALSTTSHWNPVCAVQYVGSENFNSLVTADEEGRVCDWSRSMMVHPNEYIDLKSKTQEYSLLCMGFSEGETNSFLAGTLSGSIVEAQIRGTRAGLSATYQGHEAPVTSLQWHPSRTLEEKSLFSDLVLTSSCDWTCKLWSTKSQQTPLLSFETAKDYCLEAKWHPQNPVVFCSCQSDGSIHLWDLSSDVEVPVINQITKSPSITRIAWNPSGSKLFSGDSEGSVSLWGVPNNFITPKKETNEKVSAHLRNLRQQKRKSYIT